jgi:hypothetical protein
MQPGISLSVERTFFGFSSWCQSVLDRGKIR